MKDYPNLWDGLDLTPETFEENKAVEIIRQQARLLEKKTGGIVKASFTKVEYKVPASKAITVVASVLSNMGNEVIDPNIENKKNVNEWYDVVKYKFEIYNHTYHFRVFTLLNREMFPISLDVDEGIKNELINPEFEKIKSNNELIEILGNIFSSNKLKTIITRLIGQSKMWKYADEKTTIAVT